MSQLNHAMVNFVWKEGTPELRTVAERFGVPLNAFDPTFGVIGVSPDEHVYTVRVAGEWAARISGSPGAEGPFPEGKIEPFGLESQPKKV